MVTGVGCQFRAVGSVEFPLVTGFKFCEHRSKAVFDLKFMVGWGEPKVVLDESGFSGYCFDVDWVLSFVCVADLVERKTHG